MKTGDIAWGWDTSGKKGLSLDNLRQYEIEDSGPFGGHFFRAGVDGYRIHVLPISYASYTRDGAIKNATVCIKSDIRRVNDRIMVATEEYREDIREETERKLKLTETLNGLGSTSVPKGW